ncbi:MAG: ABC transporter ATP-binding protein [Clostridia bacterium]|nr:ABC transporter ATP-binding protein [Clostridia bacterium]
MIEVRNLVKNYGPHKAVRGISFTVEPGKIYGFLGPNGAGKSTTMNIIAGTLAATAGTVTVNGHDVYAEPLAAKRCIGYLPEIPPLYPEMTAEEYLTFVGRAKGLSGSELAQQIEDAMDRTGTQDVRRRLIKNLSKGYKQRVGIAQAMLGDPEIIILDEPTVGLDPIQIIEIRDLIKSLGKTHTVILSSHILSEVSEVCDRVIIIARGRVVASDSLDGLRERYTSECTLELQLACPEEKAKELSGALSRVADGLTVKTEDAALTKLFLSYNGKRDIRSAVYAEVKKSGLPLLAMIPHVKTLEDIFLDLTGGDEPVPEEEPDAPFAAPSAPEGPEDPDGEEKKDEDDKDGGDGYKPLFG